MKLTDEQREIEIAKFSKNVFDSLGYLPELWDKDRFLHAADQNRFQGWLACRESNNEISLPKLYDHEFLCGEDQLQLHYFDEKETIAALESQGFTVKSQE